MAILLSHRLIHSIAMHVVNTSDIPVYMPDIYVATTERCNNNIESLYNISNKISHFVASYRLHSSTGLYTEPQTPLNVLL